MSSRRRIPALIRRPGSRWSQGGAAFGPADIIATPNAVAWWRARAGVTEAGTGVSAWADQISGHTAAQATDGNRPSYLASVSTLNDQPGIQFNGSTDIMAVPAHADFNPGSGHDVIWVGYDAASGGSDTIIDNASVGAAAGYRLMGESGGNIPQFRLLRSGPAFTNVSGSSSQGAAHIFRASYDSGTMYLQIDGATALTASITAGASALTDDMNFGATGGPTDFGLVTFAELLIVKRKMSDDEYQAIHDYFQSLYGTP